MTKGSRSQNPTERNESNGSGPFKKAWSCFCVWFVWVANGLKKIDGVITAIATALLAVVTVFLAFIAYWQYLELHRTDDTLKKTLLIGQRAFVHLERIDFEEVDNFATDLVRGNGINVFNAPINVGKIIRSKFSFTNAGNTPTKLLKIMLHCALVTPEQGIIDPFGLLKWDDPTRVVRRSIGAKQTVTVSVNSCDFKNTDVLLNAKMGIVPVFLIGHVTYEDWVEPGQGHTTQFGHRLIVNGLGREKFSSTDVTTEPVGAHNCTDEDCPK